MSIQGTLDEVKAMLEPYVNGFISGGRDFEGMFVQRHAPTVFLNDLRPPMLEETEEEYAQNIYPYILLRAPSGSVETDEIDAAENGITIIAVIGIHAPGEDMQGERDVCDLIDRIINAVQENPCTERCRLDTKVNWVVDEEDTHPYYHGAVTLTAYDRLVTRAEYDI